MKPAEDLRRTLLNASLDLIQSEGLEGFSMREVARRAGVSHQAPYHHFTDREAILAEMVGDGFLRLRDDMLHGLDGVKDPAARLTSIGKTYVAFALEHPALFKLMFRSEMVRQERHEIAQSCAMSAFDVLVDVVNDVAGERGERETPSPLVLASWSLAHGLATLLIEGKLDQHCGGTRAEREAAVEAILKAYETMTRAQLAKR